MVSVCLSVCLSVDLNHCHQYAVCPGQASRGAAETEGGGAECGGTHCSAHQQTVAGAALRQEHHFRNAEVCGGVELSGSVCIHSCVLYVTVALNKCVSKCFICCLLIFLSITDCILFFHFYLASLLETLSSADTVFLLR